MDSGNSGSLSLQSSSGGCGGGDEEFDSRCGGEESPLSALLRPPPAPSSSVLPGFGGSFYGIQDLATPSQSMPHWSSTTPLPAGAGSSSTAPHSSSHGMPAPASADQVAAPGRAQPAVVAPPRGSRKRTRASRRAPTTVLTTDTSNFRAMVQEFTGIPAPPFAGGASSARSRLDHLFPSRSAATLSPYLLRPFAQKLQQASSPYPQPFMPTPSSTSSANKAIATSATASTTAVSSSDGYQLASVAPSAVVGMQDHSGSGNYLPFQSPMLDGNARYPAAHPMFDAAGPPPAHQRLHDSADFSGLAHGVMRLEGMAHLHPRHRGPVRGSDELSRLVGGASVSCADEDCNTTSYSSAAGSSSFRAGPPLLERDARSTKTIDGTVTSAAMRRQGVESSWICTSE